MKSKKKMLLALGAMSAAAIGAGATSTFAWYTAANGSFTASATSAGTITLSKQSESLGGLTFDFQIKVNNTTTAAVYLGTVGNTSQDGSSLNGKPVYRVWNPSGDMLMSYEIDQTSGGGKADYHSYFQPVTISLASLKISGDVTDYKSGNAKLKPYAGTYYFNLTCNGEGKLYNSAISSCANLATAYTSGTQAVAFTVTIAYSDGGVTDGSASLANISILVEGNDEKHTESSSEATALGVAKDESEHTGGFVPEA